MANYDTLKATIDAYIRANGVKAITGPVLNGVLRAMVDSLGNGFLFAGEALPNGDPGTPDQNVVRYATQAGTYTNYGGYVHDGKHLVWFVWHGSWNAYPTQVPTDSSLPARVSQLANDAGYITADALAAFYTKAETDALLAGKQATLESGTNIKTINGESILGSGDITIQGGGSDPYFIRGTIDFNQDPPAVTITSGTYAEALAAYNAGTPVYAALTEGNGAVNIYPLAQVISPFLVFIGIGADSVLAVGLQSDGTVMVANSALVHPSDLAPVATTGDYNDLTNKPTIPGPEVFWAEYGVTTRQEVMDAVDNGKAVFVKYGPRVYTAAHINTTPGNVDNFFFASLDNGTLQSVSLDSSGSWVGPFGVLAENSSNRVSAISGNESSTTKYPNTMAVADYTGLLSNLVTTNKTNLVAAINEVASKGFRLIASGTIEEDVTQIIISADSNGNPLSLNDVVVHTILFGNTSGYTGWIKLQFDCTTGSQRSGDISVAGMFAANDNYFTTLARFKRIGNKCFPLSAYRSINNTSMKDSLGYPTQSLYAVESLSEVSGSINKITIFGYANGAVGAGTHYEIYGVDA